MFAAGNNPFIVVIDPGHGGKDPGARGSSALEKDINLSVSLMLGKMITNTHKDVKVIYTRQTDKFVGLDERANIANRNKADLFISIHTNAVKRATVRGTETFTLGLARSDENLEVAKRENAAILLEEDYQQKYEGFDPNSSESYIIFEFMQNTHMEQSISFASEIQKGFVNVKRQDRGVRQAGFLVLRKTSMPSVLVELGFITNKEEERYMKSTTGQKQLTESIYNAFCRYKREIDRKKGVLNSNMTVNTTVDAYESTQDKAASTPTTTQQQQQASSSAIIYKVQILTSDKKLSNNDKRLKGYKNTDYYIEKGMYKYTYGESTDLDAIKKIRKSLLKDFKDAFIVSFQDGKKVTK